MSLKWQSSSECLKDKEPSYINPKETSSPKWTRLALRMSKNLWKMHSVEGKLVGKKIKMKMDLFLKIRKKMSYDTNNQLMG